MIHPLIGLDLMNDLTGRPPAGPPPRRGNARRDRRRNPV
ncbi:hypothetical protein DFR74_104354 [Nocardia puris]|uniref:Uncharacterized protein n=1 Tax=Nocardia puris TaxID=208602 RepID=A0A366DNI6_9NOCA|nr:hypothetical protein DFR74_104354 [Nocardia puris]